MTSVNKKAFVIVVVILGAIAGGATYLALTPAAKDGKQEMMAQSGTTPAANPMTVPNPVVAGGGAYVDYSDNVIANTAGTKLLFFHAAWCPQCVDLETDIKKNGVPAGVTIIKVDYDTNQGLRQKYGVTLQTTVVKINDSGQLVKKFVAYDEPTLNAVVKNLL